MLKKERLLRSRTLGNLIPPHILWKRLLMSMMWLSMTESIYLLLRVGVWTVVSYLEMPFHQHLMIQIKLKEASEY